MIRKWSKRNLRFDITKMQENNKKSKHNFCMELYSICTQSGYNHKWTRFFFPFLLSILFSCIIVVLEFPLLDCWSNILILNLHQFLLVVGTNMLVYRPFGQKMLSTNFACGFLNNQLQIQLAIELMPLHWFFVDYFMAKLALKLFFLSKSLKTLIFMT